MRLPERIRDAVEYVALEADAELWPLRLAGPGGDGDSDDEERRE